MTLAETFNSTQINNVICQIHTQPDNGSGQYAKKGHTQKSQTVFFSVNTFAEKVVRGIGGEEEKRNKEEKREIRKKKSISIKTIALMRKNLILRVAWHYLNCS